MASQASTREGTPGSPEQMGALVWVALAASPPQVLCSESPREQCRAHVRGRSRAWSTSARVHVEAGVHGDPLGCGGPCSAPQWGRAGAA